MESVYIHIPFCRNICSYCDFCKMYYNEEWALRYLQSLLLEIHDKYGGEEIKTLYIGGGTPSALSINVFASSGVIILDVTPGRCSTSFIVLSQTLHAMLHPGLTGR